MTCLSFRILMLLLVTCIFIGSTNGPPPAARQNALTERAGGDAAVKARISEVYGRLPLSFEANRGQTASEVDFISRGSGYTLFVTPTEAVLALSSTWQATDVLSAQSESRVRERMSAPETPHRETTTVRMQLVGANATASPAGREELPGRVNYFRGSDPAGWRTGIPTYAKVGYEDVYPGIALVYYGNQRQLEYDFIVSPGADPNAIALTFEGAKALEIDEEGNLNLQTDGGQLTQRAPIVYQEIDGVRRNVAGRYALQPIRPEGARSPREVVAPDRRMVRFDLGDYDRRRPLVIDPVFVYSTFLGGTNGDIASAIAIDSAGSAYVTGQTGSGDFPTTAGAFDTTSNGATHVFVTKLEPNGAAAAYSTYLGGTTHEVAVGVAIDSAGNAYVTGYTTSSDFPTTPGAFDTTYGGLTDAFVTKLDASGAALVYSTYLGGANDDLAGAITVDSSESAYVTGQTNLNVVWGDFPTTPGAFDTTFGGQADAFVTKLEPSGAALAYSTYLGGVNGDQGRGIAVDSAGNAYVTGITISPDFPITPGAFDATLNAADAFVTKLEASGAALAYSTYLGGETHEQGWGIAIDSAGSAYVIGETLSSDFPTTPGAFDTTHGGNDKNDAFVTKLEATGAALAYSTYLGGASDDAGYGIATDGAGNAHVTGGTVSSDFPTTPDAFDSISDGGADAFVTTLEASGAALVYSTYLGGANVDEGYAIAVDSAGGAYVTGYTQSSDFPTTPGAFDTTLGGVFDAFVVKFGEPIETEPDLVVTAITNPPAVLVLKQKFSVTDSTHNQGTAAVATTNRYYLSVDTVRNAGDKLLTGKRAVPTLADGGTSTGNANLTVATSTKVGVYYMLACADDLKRVTESDEGNNCRPSTTTVEVRAPDLVETTIGNPPATASPGGSFSVTDTVRNAGNASAGLSTTRYYLSLDIKKTNADPLLTGTRAITALAAGAVSSGSVTVTIPSTIASASYYLLACGDDLKKVTESNEKNNCKVSTTKVAVSP